MLVALTGSVSAQTATIKDVYPDKARYSPHESIQIRVEMRGPVDAGEMLFAKMTDLGEQVGTCGTVALTAHSSTLLIPCSVPATDFRGYLVTVELQSSTGRVLDRRITALDISSDWTRFPRYGYLAHWNKGEGARPAEWIDELSRFHINGLEFYDFQYRHDQPLAGSILRPAPSWKDIAGREVDASLVKGFIQEAHAHNMMAMAYNASYSAYDDVFTRQNPLPIQWGTWTTANGPRNPETAKSLSFDATNWSTSKLFYMNQNDAGWQNYIFGQMQNLFEVYSFDGWHIDTFGEKSAFAFDGSRVDYVAGFKPYIDRARAMLKKPILFNAVNTFGQDRIANSTADFVYSELWEDHETFASIMETAEQVHLANPTKAYVIAAYVHRYEGKEHIQPQTGFFNVPSVLLTDATIFASGAAHIELGDGDRMLSNEYFPADTRFTVSPELHCELRHYYDFLTAYEVYLRSGLVPAPIGVSIEGTPVDAVGVPNTVWSISRQRDDMIIVHLINLQGSNDPHWRDVSLSRTDAPRLHNLRVGLSLTNPITSIGWASPDLDGGRFHSLQFHKHTRRRSIQIEVTLPELHYWDTLFIKTAHEH